MKFLNVGSVFQRTGIESCNPQFTGTRHSKDSYDLSNFFGVASFMSL